jgi:hypothetical protein
MSKTLQSIRWKSFQQRADYAPGSVYRHQTHGWEYIPVHPFGDEPAVLARLQLQPKDCHSADAWWGIEGDATLFESSIVRVTPGGARLFAKATPHREQSVYLVAVFDAPFVTRTLFEDAMVKFVEAGFPHASQFRLRWGDPHRVLST